MLEASSVADAVAILGTVPVHLVFVDLHVPGPRDGLRVARFAQDLHLPPRIILTSGKVRPEDLPEAPAGVEPVQRVVDYLAGMTDRFCLSTYERLAATNRLG